MIHHSDSGIRSGALATGRLGAAHMVFFVMSATAPLTVVAGILVTAYAITGSIGLPITFVAVAVVLAVFASGFVAAGRYLPHAGAIYAYVAHGLGRTPAVAAAWVALVGYNAIQTCTYGAIGAAVSPLVKHGVGIELPWPVYAVTAWILVAVLGVSRVDLNSRVLAVLLLCEVTLLIVLDTAFLAHPAGGMAWSVWSPTHLLTAGIGAQMVICVLGYVGFEGTVVFSEEARDLRTTVRRATYAAIGVTTGLYAISAWALTVTVGTGQIVAAATGSGTELVFDLAADRLGPVAATAGHVLFATSLVAAMISFHNMAARYTFALGREHILPGVFARTSHAGAPIAGSLAQSALGLTVIVVFALSGADPVVRLFYTASVAGAVGIMILLVAAAAAVVGFFARDRRGESRWTTRIAPVASLVALTVMLTLAIMHVDTLLGVAPDHPLRWGLPLGYLVVITAGLVWGAVLRRRRPHAHAAIGLAGKTALLSVPAPSLPLP
jgi:amino acid transporter